MKITETITLARLDNGSVMQVDSVTGHLFGEPLRSLLWNSHFNPIPETQPEVVATPEDVANAVCDYFKIDHHEIKSRSRKRNRVLPRQITAYYLRFKTDLTFSAIGQFFGGYDHTTAIFSIDKITEQVAVGDPVREHIENLDHILNIYPDVQPRPVSVSKYKTLYALKFAK